MSGERFGLVLGAGGVLGVAWTIGALRAFEQTTGRDPRRADVILGTSAGAILAASLGCGISTEALANHQSGVPAEGDPDLTYDYETGHATGLPGRPKLRFGSTSLLLNAVRHPRRTTGLAALASVIPEGRGSLAAVGAVVDSVAPAGPVAWAPHPQTWIVAMDFRTGERVVFGQEGAPSARLSKAVVASCSIPGWYQPVRIGGRRYVDGGMVSPTSLDLLAEMELDVVYVLSPMTSFSFDTPSGMGMKLERRVRRRLTRRLSREADVVRETGTEVVLLCPGPDDLAAIGANLMDASRRDRVFQTSLRTTAAALTAEPLASAS
jgi:NTE family protein